MTRHLNMFVKCAEAERFKLLDQAEAFGVDGDPRHFAPFRFCPGTRDISIWVDGYFVGCLRRTIKDGVVGYVVEVRDEVSEDADPSLERAVRNVIRITSEIGRYVRAGKSETEKDYSERSSGSSYTLSGVSRNELMRGMFGAAGVRKTDVHVRLRQSGQFGLTILGKRPTHSLFHGRDRDDKVWSVVGYERGLRRVVSKDALMSLIHQGNKVFRENAVPDVSVLRNAGVFETFDSASLNQSVQALAHNTIAPYQSWSIGPAGYVAEKDPEGNVRILNNGALIVWFKSLLSAHDTTRFDAALNDNRARMGLDRLGEGVAAALGRSAIVTFMGGVPRDYVSLSSAELRDRILSVDHGYDL